MIVFTGLYDIAIITAFIIRAYNDNRHIHTIVEPNIYLPPSEKSAIHNIIQIIYFREKISGALCDDAINIHHNV